jgi:hypothetical protein
VILNKDDLEVDDDLLMLDFSLVETLNRYPSCMPSKEKMPVLQYQTPNIIRSQTAQFAMPDMSTVKRRLPITSTNNFEMMNSNNSVINSKKRKLGEDYQSGIT